MHDSIPYSSLQNSQDMRREFCQTATDHIYTPASSVFHAVKEAARFNNEEEYSILGTSLGKGGYL